MTDATDAADPDAGPEPGAPDRLGFDVVIATRNRAEALALSIPLILAQSRQPERLIVIDSSDDHAPVKAAVAQAAEGWPGTVIVEHSAPGSAASAQSRADACRRAGGDLSRRRFADASGHDRGDAARL